MIDNPSDTSIGRGVTVPKELDFHEKNGPLRRAYGRAILSRSLYHRFPTAVNVGESYRSFVKSKCPMNKLPIINQPAIIRISDKQDSLPGFWSDDLI